MFDWVIGRAVAVAAPRTEVTNPLSEWQNLSDIIGFILNIVFYVGIALTVIFLIIGGIRYIISGGDKAGTEGARNAITNAIIGFVVVIGAFAIKVIVQNVLGANLTNTNIIPSF